MTNEMRRSLRTKSCTIEACFFFQHCRTAVCCPVLSVPAPPSQPSIMYPPLLDPPFAIRTNMRRKPLTVLYLADSNFICRSCTAILTGIASLSHNSLKCLVPEYPALAARSLAREASAQTPATRARTQLGSIVTAQLAVPALPLLSHVPLCPASPSQLCNDATPTLFPSVSCPCRDRSSPPASVLATSLRS